MLAAAAAATPAAGAAAATVWVAPAAGAARVEPALYAEEWGLPVVHLQVRPPAVGPFRRRPVIAAWAMATGRGAVADAAE